MITVNLADGLRVHDTQKQRLGFSAPDQNGDLWRYVKFQEALTRGEICRDMQHSDFGSVSGIADPGEVSEAAAVGTNRLVDAASTFRKDEVVGAIGEIVGGAAIGQIFMVTRVVEPTELEVRVFSNKKGTWSERLTTASRYRLQFPGVAYQGDVFTVAQIPAGSLQAESAARGKYGWVKLTGPGYLKLDASAQDPGQGSLLVPSTAGLVQGIVSASLPNLAVGLNAIVGTALWSLGGTTDRLIWADLNMNTRFRSFKFDSDEHPFNRVDIY